MGDEYIISVKGEALLMAGRRANIQIDVRGSKIIINKLRALNPRLEEGQRIAGQKLGQMFVNSARRIIANKSPRSSGQLKNSIYSETNKANKGWKTQVSSTAPYAYMVEAGRGPARVNIDGNLRDWIQRVLGDGAAQGLARKRVMWVGLGTNPNYDTGIGMRFFQDPFIREQDDIAKKYQELVTKALSTLR